MLARILSDNGAFNPSSFLIVADVSQWLPVWITPFWLIAVGLAAGAGLLIAFFGILAGLSFLPPLGNLAQNRFKATVVATCLSLLMGIALCVQFVPQVNPEKYRLHLVLPMLTIGVLLGWGLVYGVWSRTRQEMLQILSEGPMPFILGTAGIVALIGFSGSWLVENPRGILESVRQVNLLDDGTRVVSVSIPGIGEDVLADEAPFVRAGDLQYDASTITELSVVADRFVRIADANDPDLFSRAPTQLIPGESVSYRLGEKAIPPIPLDSDLLHIQNTETDEATISFTFVRKPAVRQASTVPLVAFSFFLLVVAYIVFRQAAPRIAAVSLATAKSEMAQPLYLVLLALGVVALLLLMIVPFHTLGEDIKMMKDCSLTLIMVFALVQFVWAAGSSVSEEIEGRTALTVLSKPISRSGFLIGKFLGILMTVLVLFIILGTVLAATVSYKPLFEARESSEEQPVWQIAHEEVLTTFPPLVLFFMETVAIGAIAVALATRLPLLPNFIICFTIYVIGNLTAPIVRSAVGENAFVAFFGKFIAVIVPNLNAFSGQAAIDSGLAIPPIYLAGVFNYLICFCIMILMVAMLLFEDRDLA